MGVLPTKALQQRGAQRRQGLVPAHPHVSRFHPETISTKVISSLFMMLMHRYFAVKARLLWHLQRTLALQAVPPGQEVA